MSRVSLPTRHANRAGIGTGLALAIALISGSVIGATAFASPAHAKEKKKKVKQKYSKAFIKAYKPANEAFNAAEDAAAAEPIRAMIPAVLATVETDDDKMAMGQLILNLGLKLSDPALQSQGVKLELESGKVPADKVKLLNYHVGSLAWTRKDYSEARLYLERAFDAGFEGNNIERLIAETYFSGGQNAEGLAAVDRMAKTRMAAGSVIPEEALRRALQIAYEANMSDATSTWAANLVRYHPSEATWKTSLAVLLDAYQFNLQESLDVFRLMRLTNSMTEGRQYVDYIEAADARRMANEVLPIIEEAISRGLLERSDIFVQEALEIAQGRAAADRAEAPTLVNEARGGANGVTARGVGDLFMSYGADAEAEDMFGVALTKGGVDSDRVLTRLGIVQVRQGKLAAARTNFEKVNGNRALIAAMWMIYIDTQSSAAPAVVAEAPAEAAAE